LFINYYLIIVFLQQSLAAHQVHIPAGRCASTNSTPRNRLQANCPDFITKDQWPLNLLNINPIDYRVGGAMLEAFSKLKTKSKTILEPWVCSPLLYFAPISLNGQLERG